ncbi:MAG: DNA mismatch repair endonuclease MutL [Ruminococcaceae bacterium]|nr:DNA mismatch repair endonuclease MutL [Oscillospiraceae bacterium]
MGKINILDASVANMIAAGEVVERPASVIKELVENSIDAGATTISVEIKNGGISYMRVTDNGHGMESDDVGLAFVRHATSKILEAKDLEAINTLGFRGEALCSIAAVSKVVLTTKTKDAKNATRVYIEGGEMDDVDEVGAPNGTTIEVKKLFYNTPARMKFLKKDTTEAGYITDIMQRFILAHPEISFRYINSGKQIFISLGDGELVNAIYTIYGKDYAKSLISVNYGDNTMKISGYIGKSTIARPNRTYQSFFVNNRYIKNRTAIVALEEAYKNQLMGGKFPFAVLNLEINPAFVDVNVHPNKTEVKFSDEKKVFDTVYWGVKNALYEKPVIPEVSIKQKRDAYKNKDFSGEAKAFVQTLLNVEKFAPEKQTAPLEKQIKPEVQPDKSANEKKQTTSYIKPASTFNIFDIEEENEIEIKPEKTQVKLAFNEQNDEVYTVSKDYLKEENTETADVSAIAKQKEVIVKETVDKQPQVPEIQTKGDFDKDYKIVGTVFDTYIILERQNELLLIDQHAAHERLKFERLKRDMEKSGVKIQSLIAPVVVDLAATEFAYVCENMQNFSKLGFEIEEFGENTIIINGAPADTNYDDIKDLFIELLGQMMADKKQIITGRDERALYTIACKAAIKANQTLNEREIDALVKDVLALEGINTCPHGRPITISLTRYEIEKQFKRIV